VRRLRVGVLAIVAVSAGTLEAQTLHVDSTTVQYGRFADQRAAILVMIQRAAPRIGLGGWQFAVVFDSVPRRPDAPPGRSAAGVLPKPQLRAAVLFFDLREIPRYGECEIVLHELLHIRISPVLALAYHVTQDHPIVQDMVRGEAHGFVTDLARGMAREGGCR